MCTASTATPATGSAGSSRRCPSADDAEFVQVRHEETAAFAACADVKYGGSPIGCCAVTSGPGAIHALNGLYDAKLDHQPVVALLGHTAQTAQGGGYYQEVDLSTLFADVGGYVAEVKDPSQVRHIVDRACRTALADRTVAVIILPSDVLEEDAVPEPPDAHGYYQTSAVPSSRPGAPADAALRAAAEVLNAGEKVAILAGAGALGASQVLTEVAEPPAAPGSPPRCSARASSTSARPGTPAPSACSGPRRRGTSCASATRC